MLNIDKDELAIIRIALRDKMLEISKYIAANERVKDVEGKLYWEEAMNRHKKLLDKLNKQAFPELWEKYEKFVFMNKDN